MNILYFLQIQKRGNKYKMVMLPNFLNGKCQIYTGDECINHTAHHPLYLHGPLMKNGFTFLNGEQN